RRTSGVVGGAFFGGETPPASGAAPTEGPAPAADARPPRARVTRTGLDQLAAQGFAPLAGRSVGLVTNQTGVDAQGRRNIDLLARAPGVRLRAIFSPEHGLTGQVDANVPHGRDAATGLPVWSLYGSERRAPSPTLAPCG